MSKFEMGSLYMTQTVNNAIAENELFAKDITAALKKYTSGNWGNMCEDDRKSNDDAVESGERIVAAYNTSEGKIYIITEWDRSYTTVMFANEY